MTVEIERKFLVRDLSVLQGLRGRELCQGYPAADEIVTSIQSGRTAGTLVLQTHRTGQATRRYEVRVDSDDTALLQALYSVDGVLTGLGVRIRVDGTQRGLVTLKSKNPGMSRAEFEFDIPLTTAQELLALHCSHGCLTKLRHVLPLEGGRAWEIDVFKGNLTGLVTAEIELQSEAEPVEVPAWLGREVTDDARYSNAALAAAQAVPSERP